MGRPDFHWEIPQGGDGGAPLATRSAAGQSAAMLRRFVIRLVPALVAAAIGATAPAAAQQPRQSHAYLLQVMTPDGKGFLPMAEAEAQTALVQVTVGLRDPENLDHLKEYARAAQHAIDPVRITTGPGRGYGVKKAAEGVVSYVTAAGKSPDASEKVQSFSRWVATSAENVIERADRVTDLLGKVERMKTATNAARVMHLVRGMCQEILLGKDTNKDGEVSWKKHEGGLAQAKRNMTVMLRIEKLME